VSRRRPPPIPAHVRRPTPFSQALTPIVEAADRFEDTPLPVTAAVEETTPPIALDALPGFQVGREVGRGAARAARAEGRLEGATVAVREMRSMFLVANNSPEFIEKMTVFLSQRLALAGISLPPPDRIDRSRTTSLTYHIAHVPARIDSLTYPHEST
jgi:hypothetical protein